MCYANLRGVDGLVTVDDYANLRGVDGPSNGR